MAIRILYVFALGMLSLTEPCNKIIEKRKVCNTCDTITTTRTFPDCADSLTYTDSTSNDKELTFTGSIYKGDTDGIWMWFQDGKLYQSTTFVHNEAVKNCWYYKDTATCYEDERLNDSVYYERITRGNGFLIAEGKMVNFMRFGEWFVYDERNGTKTENYYVPEEKTDTIVKTDSTTGIISYLMCTSLGVLDGVQCTYDNNGKLILTEKYIKGVKQ